MGLVIPYKGESFYETEIAGLKRRLPIVKVGENTWIASNAGLVLGDVEFIEAAASSVASLIKPYRPDVVVTAEAKALALAYEVARRLGHDRFVVARKSVKAYMSEVLVEQVKSITTQKPQVLVLTKEDAELIRDRRACVFDDVVSTGGTVRALENLVGRAGGQIVCKAAIWLEGPWCLDRGIIHLAELPVFKRL